MDHRGVAQLASALAWGARGRPFKSDHPDRKKKPVNFDLQAFSFYDEYLSVKIDEILIEFTVSR